VLGEPRDLHLIAVEVKGLGDAPLANHKVRLLDPETGVPIDDWTETDDKGVLHAQVKDDRTYRIEIFDDALESGPQARHPDEAPSILLCHFVDAEGSPLAGETIEVTIGEEKTEMRTDAQGRIDSPMHLGAVELKVRDHVFQAHSIPAADREKDETLYRFVLGEPRDVHLIAVEVKSLGGTLLPNHKVRVLDPETGMPVSDWLETDDKGVLRTDVPEERTYRIEIADEGIDAASPTAPHADAAPAVLFCHFVDANGAPIADEPVTATRGEDTFDLRTDAEGKIDAPAQLGDYKLKIKGREFAAHALPAADRETASGYRFVVKESE
jgi:hypothetical protein